jgi:DNA-binding response OmpR family regulator
MEVLSQILMGFNVERTRKCLSAKDAHVFLTKDTFDLVIVDDDMPEWDGFGLIAAIRRDAEGPNYTVPVLLTSGNPTETVVQRARDCGANFVIAKPIVPGILLARIQWLARNNRQFVTSDTYCGPDRRFHHKPLPDGQEERRIETLRLMAAPERALSQDEVNSLFE